MLVIVPGISHSHHAEVTLIHADTEAGQSLEILDSQTSPDISFLPPLLPRAPTPRMCGLLSLMGYIQTSGSFNLLMSARECTADDACGCFVLQALRLGDIVGGLL